MHTSSTLRAFGAVLAVAALTLADCSIDTDSGTHTDADKPPSVSVSMPTALEPYYEQKLRWRDCDKTFQCATLRAPLDYTDPLPDPDDDLKLAVSRKKATGDGKRLGSLLVNPGGPGGSAIDYLQDFAARGYPAKVRARYDMVGMDPRGVARSEPVTCLSDKDMDAYTRTDQTPDDQAEAAGLVSAYKKFAKGCATRSGRLLGHVSTVDSARDMDVLRAALGDRKLTYVGASYGTLLGATYADLFPRRVGRLVLDGALDPSLPALRMNRDQTAGFDVAFRAFAKNCVRHADCPLGRKSVNDASKRLGAFFTKMDRHPFKVGDRRTLTESLATTGVIAAMYDDSSWPQLRKALTSAMHGEGRVLLALADLYYERDAHGHYANLMYANAAVNCLDLPPAFSGPEAVESNLPAFEKASPTFGRTMVWGPLNCTYWPHPATADAHPLHANGAAPIVVVGTTRDPATPYRWARALASQLTSGTLLTYEGDGHTAYGRGSACIDNAINTYLVAGTPPRPAKRCT